MPTLPPEAVVVVSECSWSPVLRPVDLDLIDLSGSPDGGFIESGGPPHQQRHRDAYDYAGNQRPYHPRSLALGPVRMTRGHGGSPLLLVPREV
jgi:hypothetical protein